MSTSIEPSASPKDEDRRRTTRRRAAKVHLPKWLTNPTQAQAIAHGRCLMILSVLAGQKTVQAVIEEHNIYRRQYYLLESRALEGMVRALAPATSETVSEATDERRELREAQRRIRALNVQVKELTQRKRSMERLLALVMKSTRVPVYPSRRRRRARPYPSPAMPGGDLR